MEILNFISAQLPYLKSRTKCAADAEDILQDVFVKVWIRKQYFESKPIEEQRKIISLAVRNQFYDFIRFNKMGKREKNDYFLPKFQAPEVWAKMELEDVLEILKPVEDHQQLLDSVFGLTTKEIMEKYDLKQSLALKKIYSARQFLKENYQALN